jgi:VIT1/CCC1 family predicted Fe2+/Mn2+ transporter
MEALDILRNFWKAEVLADHLYRFIASRYRDPDKKSIIMSIGKMERGHAAVWNDIAQQTCHVSFEISIRFRLQILWMKFLSLVMPLTFFVHYMEHHERNSILQYSELLENYRDNETIRETIATIIREEIGHEWMMMEQIADRTSYVEKAKEAIHGMTAGIIETLALVIGLLAVHASSLIIGLTGLISTIGGMVAIMTISYISAKGHHDLFEGKIKELNVKKEIHPDTLKHELKSTLLEKGFGEKTATDMMEALGEDTYLLSHLLKTVKIKEEATIPTEAVKTTTTFFIIGTLPIIIPFFAGIIWQSGPLVPALISFAIAIVIVSIAGLFIAVLSGGRIMEKVVHNVLVIFGSCSLTYLIGLTARLRFGIEAGH